MLPVRRHFLFLCLASLLFPILIKASPSDITALAFHPQQRTGMHQKSVAAPKVITAMEQAANVFDEPTQEWDVDRYQQQHSFIWEYGSSLVDLARPQPGERILDVGCGTGELTNSLYTYAAAAAADNNNLHCMGMDADPNMIQMAQEQFPGIHFFVGDVRNFSLDDDDVGLVDLLFSNAALHWVPPGDAKRAVQAMSRAIRPGGRLVVEFGGKGNVQEIVQAILETLEELSVESSRRSCPWYFPSISEFTSLLEAHEIEVSQAQLFDRPTLLQDGENGMPNWLRMFGNKFFEGLANDEIEDVLKRVCDKLRPKLFDGEEWTADYRRIRVISRKL